MRAAASSTSLHASPEAPILEARDLSVRFRGVEGTVVAVHRASIALYPGEVLGIVGESGSGKSTLAQALMGHRPPGSTIASGEVLFGGRSILDAPKSWLQGIWGSRGRDGASECAIDSDPDHERRRPDQRDDPRP